MKNFRKRLFGDVIVMGGKKTRYLIDELFTTNVAAGSLNGLVSNGTGTTAQKTRLVTDTNSVLSQTGGVLNFATGGLANGDPGNWWGAFSRVAGRTLIGQITPSTDGGYIGWDTNQAGIITANSHRYRTTGITQSPGTAVIYGVNPMGFSMQSAIVLRTAGGYSFVKGMALTNWTLLFWTASDVDATLYPGLGCSSTTYVSIYSYLRVPEDTTSIINRLVSQLYDNFTRADGALGSSLAIGPDGQPATSRAWTGATWLIDTNQAKNTPTLGADMVDAGAGVFTAGTYAWVAQGANTIANVGNELEVTYVNDATGAKEMLANVAGDLSGDLTIGAWYRLDWQSYVDAGSSVGFNVYDGVNTFLTTEAANVLTSHFQTFRSRSAAGCYLINSLMAAGEIFYLDNWTLKPLTDATLFATTTDIAEDDVIIEVDLATVVAGAQAGVRLAYVDASNYLLCYYDYTLGKVVLDQLLAGAWTNLFNTTKAYAAASRLIIWKSSTAVRVYYGIAGSEALVTATTCNAAVAVGTQVSLFSTDVGNRISLIDVRGVGNSGEYSFFDTYLP